MFKGTAGSREIRMAPSARHGQAAGLELSPFSPYSALVG